MRCPRPPDVAGGRGGNKGRERKDGEKTREASGRMKAGEGKWKHRT